MTDNFFEVICCGIKLDYRFLEAVIEIPKPRETVMLKAFITIEIAWDSTRTIASESDF